MPRFYITKWATTRGILVFKGQAVLPEKYHVPRVWVNLPGMRYAQPLLVDREVFQDLDEAKADVKARFEDALQSAKNQVSYLHEALERFDELYVHEDVRSIGACRAIPGLEVHSGGPWVVEPKRLKKEQPAMSKKSVRKDAVSSLKNLVELEESRQVSKPEPQEVWVQTTREGQLRSFRADTPCMTSDKTRTFLIKDLPEHDYNPFLVYDHSWIEVERSFPPDTVELKVTLTVASINNERGLVEDVRSRLLGSISREMTVLGAQAEIVKVTKG